jgi:hypothetical protein
VNPGQDVGMGSGLSQAYWQFQITTNTSACLS